MDIVEFFQLSNGKWFSQRSNLAAKASPGGRSDLYIEALSATDPVVIQLCEQNNVDPSQALCGVRIRWDGSMELEQKKYSGSTVMVPISSSSQANEGTLLRASGSTEVAVTSRYMMGTDDALTLITESESLYAEERVWFASPNLRLRTRILRQPNGVNIASFCSEIRMGVTKPAEN
ncbi:MAG: phycobiliprotein lyase [Leptolyngbyaceae cyanobacterium]